MRRGIAWLTGLLGVAALAPAAAQATVVLNEVNCEATDWVEIVNTSAAAVDLGDWLLTDDPLDGTRADHRLVFAAGTTIAPQGTLLVEKGAAGFPFGIKCGDDTIRLADPAGVLVDEVAVPELSAPTATWGRYPNAGGPWRETNPTPGAPNEPATGGGPLADEAAWLFEPGRVAEIDLGLSAEAREELEEEPDEYVAGTFALRTPGGAYGPYTVGVRLKGSGSFRPLGGKAAFKVSFDHVVAGQRFLGLRRLTLNNMVQDPSMVREALAYEVFRDAGVPAPRTGHAYVRLNGEDYGVYLNVETLDDVALPRWFPTTRHLYEGPLYADVAPGMLEDFEVDEGSEHDRGDLEMLAAAAEATPFTDAMAAVADLGELTRMWAVERYVGHWDGYTREGGPNNYYLHSDATGRFSMLPWGTDQTWSVRLPFEQGPTGRLFTACLRATDCRARFREALIALPARVGALDLDARASSLAAALAPWQQLDPRREDSLDEITAGVAAVRAFIAARPADLAAWLAAPGPPQPAPVPAPDVAPGGTAAAGGSPGPAAGSPAAPRGPLSVRWLQVGRARLVTRVRVAGPGVVTQVVSVDGGVTACRERTVVRGAGTLTLRCPFTTAARRARVDRALPATVRTRFVPVAGPPVTRVHRRVLGRAAQATTASAIRSAGTVRLRPAAFAE
ncbi:MAG TPA: CotH kinase family protein [Solirubrobacteraceae bacterium]|nr:CotH kinase family protein [Solirubrobacteraceae bacterium]